MVKGNGVDDVVFVGRGGRFVRWAVGTGGEEVPADWRGLGGELWRVGEELLRCESCGSRTTGSKDHDTWGGRHCHVCGGRVGNWQRGSVLVFRVAGTEMVVVAG